MNDNIKVAKYNGVDTFEGLVELIKAIQKVVPDITFKSEDMQTYHIDKSIYPDGIAYSYHVFHNEDLNNHIGRVSIEQWASSTPKYGIQSINIDDGRQSYGLDGQYKTSIHAKNIVRVAKKVFKPFTFEQIANRCNRQFKGRIDSLAQSMRWELRQKTCDGYEDLLADWENLYHMGYKPKSDNFKKMMEYVMQNKERIDKYNNYNPNHYFVLIKDDCVQYRLNIAPKGEPHITVPSKDHLPDDIKGKLFVLDITDKQDFVEDVGLKENDGAYWIIA